MVDYKLLILKGGASSRGVGGWIFRGGFGIFHEFRHEFPMNFSVVETENNPEEISIQ